ncbi:hypothetical protein LPB140_07995 [Sphingorhabdus lutea]|uniref:Uncharacterized protein n=1 Tax=Sphingorhabdus lutea TaxID=1913578 RepID=A0A1L3JC87_9SPHN|nr:hypothetical protein [Sphingorhabdus lutea]APG62738.1 hypothetical protein LPB140_07995 [Sphingorhabdus lutea]
MTSTDSHLKILAAKRKEMRQAIGNDFQFTKEILKPSNIISRTKKKGVQKIHIVSEKMKNSAVQNKKSISIGGAIMLSGIAAGIWYKFKNKQ